MLDRSLGLALQADIVGFRLNGALAVPARLLDTVLNYGLYGGFREISVRPLLPIAHTACNAVLEAVLHEETILALLTEHFDLWVEVKYGGGLPLTHLHTDGIRLVRRVSLTVLPAGVLVHSFQLVPAVMASSTVIRIDGAESLVSHCVVLERLHYHVVRVA